MYVGIMNIISQPGDNHSSAQGPFVAVLWAETTIRSHTSIGADPPPPSPRETSPGPRVCSLTHVSERRPVLPRDPPIPARPFPTPSAGRQASPAAARRPTATPRAKRIRSLSPSARRAKHACPLPTTAQTEAATAGANPPRSEEQGQGQPAGAKPPCPGRGALRASRPRRPLTARRGRPPEGRAGPARPRRWVTGTGARRPGRRGTPGAALGGRRPGSGRRRGRRGLPVFLEELVGLAEAVVQQHVDAGQRQLRVLDGQRGFPVLPPRRRLLRASHDDEEAAGRSRVPPLPTHLFIYLCILPARRPFPGGSVLPRRARREQPGAPGARGGANTVPAAGPRSHRPRCGDAAAASRPQALQKQRRPPRSPARRRRGGRACAAAGGAGGGRGAGGCNGRGAAPLVAALGWVMVRVHSAAEPSAVQCPGAPAP